jgi:hypothetical protein
MNSTARSATKDFFERAQQIMDSESYTEEGKKKAVDKEAERLLSDIFEDLPGIRTLRRRQKVFEREYSIGKGPVYCPGCSTWTPKPPREITVLEREWVEIRRREKAEMIRKAMEGPGAPGKGGEHVQHGRKGG